MHFKMKWAFPAEMLRPRWARHASWIGRWPNTSFPLLCSCCEGVHHTRRIDQSGARVDRNRHPQRFGDLFCRRSVLARRMDMCRDAAVALACHTNRKRNQFARLRVEPGGLRAGITKLTIAS